MSYTKIAAIYADSETLSGQTVTVGGWVRTIRDMKQFGFLERIQPPLVLLVASV